MSKQKPQEVLVYTDFTSAGDKAIEWGIYLAQNLKKNLLILHVINDNTPQDKDLNNKDETTKKRLNNLVTEISNQNKIITESYYEEGCTCSIINATAERRNVAFIIAAIHGLNDPQYLSGKSLIKIVRKARIPYLVLQKNSPKPNENKAILLPITMQKEIKQKVGWATFFAFKLMEKIQLIQPKNTEDLASNIQFAHKFFKSFEIDFSEQQFNTSQFKIKTHCIKIADTSKHLMLVVLTTKNLSVYNRIFGTEETRLIANKKGLPVLLINPKNDLYIPCL
jgi:hypothetical protein